MPKHYSSIGPALKKLQEKKPPVNDHDVNKAAELLTEVNNYSEATSKPSIELPEEIPLRPYSRADFEPFKYHNIPPQLKEQFRDLDSPGFTNTSSTTITTNSPTSTTSSLDSSEIIQSFKALELLLMPNDKRVPDNLRKLKEFKNNKGPVR